MSEKVGVEITGSNDLAIVAFNATSISSTEGIAEVAKNINTFVENHRPKKMIIDFEKVKFFSSQVLGMLLALRTRLNEYKAEIVISSIDPQLHRVFRITNLDKMFRFFADKGTAVKALSSDD